MPISSVFSIARSSLFAHQQALAVTSSNLANANNPAYSRQVVMFGATSPDHRATFSFGTGVAVNEVMRIRNNVTDVQIRNNNPKYYDAEKKSMMMKQIESLFSEPSDYGLSNLMTGFFNSFDELAVDPLSTSLRTNITQSAQTISEKVHSIYEGIEQTKNDVRAEARNVSSTVNKLLEQIHIANKQIYEASVVGHYSNDLIDQRDAMLDQLSQYVNINANIDENNVANVSIGGVFAVDGLHHVQFKVVQEGDTLSLANEEGSGHVSLNGGSLNGLIDLFNEDLPNQLETLEEIINAFMESVNDIHRQGYSITDPSVNGINFFTSFENGVLEINEDIINEPYNIAVSADGSKGNNEIALLLAELKDEKLLNGKTLSDNYSEYISEIGNEINLQEQNAESYALVLNQLNLQKMEYSGVSTDEEMIDVMRFQRSYDAAAKLINVADELLQTLLNLV